jgi:flagellar basal-body rod protein FlgG
MQDALTLAVQSMQGAMDRTTILSHNMVNLATPGYRREIPVQRPFAAVINAANSGAGTGAALPQYAVDATPSALRPTGQAFDLALQGEGYFVVNTAQGTAYTRAGGFHLEADGRLVNEQGMPVQGMQGNIRLRGATPKIGPHGEITQEGREIDRIRVVALQASSLYKGGDGLLRSSSTGEAVPAANARVQSGYLESSNVSPLSEMVGLTESVRQFEAAQRLFQGYDDQLNNAIRTLTQF